MKQITVKELKKEMKAMSLKKKEMKILKGGLVIDSFQDAGPFNQVVSVDFSWIGHRVWFKKWIFLKGKSQAEPDFSPLKYC